MSTKPESCERYRHRLPILLWGSMLFLLTACRDPLPSETQWLAGSWRWLGSCCGYTGAGLVADAPDALVIDLHYNGDVDIYDHGVQTRTNFEVATDHGYKVLRFRKPVLHATQFGIDLQHSTSDRLVIAEFPQRCTDCPDRHTFTRAP